MSLPGSLPRRFGSCAIGILCLLGVARAVEAEPTEWAGLRIEANCGFGGASRPTAWAPVRLDVENRGAEAMAVELRLKCEGAEGPFHALDWTVFPPGARHRVTLYARVGSYSGKEGVSLRLVNQRGESLDLRVDVNIADRVVAIVGPSALGWRVDAKRNSVERAVVRLDPEDLPDRRLGYESIDVLILHSPTERTVSGGARVRAFREWVHSGGQVVIIPGPGGAAAGTLGYLEEMLPARMASGEVLEDVEFLPCRREALWTGLLRKEGEDELSRDEGLLRRPKWLDAGSGDAWRGSFDFLRLTEVHGRVLLEAGDLPAAVEGRFGMGRVVLLAFDPARQPFHGTQEMGDLWEAMLVALPLLEDAVEPEAEYDYEHNYEWETPPETDLAVALRHREGGTRVPYGLFVLLLGVYVLVVGPLDYWLLKRWGRLEWTWVTLPTWVLIFTAATYAVSRVGRQDEYFLRDVALAEVGPGSSLLTGVTWTGIFSPESSVVDLKAPLAGAMIEPGRLGGRDVYSPFGGMMEAAPDLAVPSRPESYPLAVPCAAWSWRHLRMTWGRDMGVEQRFWLHRDGDDRILTNDTDFALASGVVVLERHVYSFRAVEPGGEVRLKELDDLAEEVLQGADADLLNASSEFPAGALSALRRLAIEPWWKPDLELRRRTTGPISAWPDLLEGAGLVLAGVEETPPRPEIGVPAVGRESAFLLRSVVPLEEIPR